MNAGLAAWLPPGAQHFSTPQGLYPGPQAPKPYICRPLEAWYQGDPEVLAGSWRNAAAAPLVPRLADAHLRIFNASVPLWESHMPGECECGLLGSGCCAAERCEQPAWR